MARQQVLYEPGRSVEILVAEAGLRHPICPLAHSTNKHALDELVDAPPGGDPRIHLRPITRHGMTMLPLTR